MSNLNLTPEGEKHEAGFNGKFGPLKGRPDLNLFLINAYLANRQDHIAFFKDPPTLKELQAAQAKQKLEGNPVYTTTPAHLPSGATAMPLGPATPLAEATPDTTEAAPAAPQAPAPVVPAGGPKA